jgi:hypothetical protein
VFVPLRSRATGQTDGLFVCAETALQPRARGCDPGQGAGGMNGEETVKARYQEAIRVAGSGHVLAAVRRRRTGLASVERMSYVLPPPDAFNLARFPAKVRACVLDPVWRDTRRMRKRSVTCLLNECAYRIPLALD